MPIRVYDLDIDEWNAAEAARHGVTDVEMVEVLDNRPVFKPNRKGHKATVVMIGPTNGGRFLTVPLAPTEHSEIWRPSTAWPTKPAERAKYDADSGSRRAN